MSLARTGTRLSAEAEKRGKLKDARNILDVARMSALVHGWKSREEPGIEIKNSNVILTQADIKELQELHRKALESAK